MAHLSQLKIKPIFETDLFVISSALVASMANCNITVVGVQFIQRKASLSAPYAMRQVTVSLFGQHVS